MAARPPDASRHASSTRKRGGRRQQLSPLQSAATVADGCPRLHPTTKLVLPQVTTIHMFSGNAMLCFIQDKKSGKDFLVDTGATLSLIPFSLPRQRRAHNCKL
jgi:hypothetical protein